MIFLQLFPVKGRSLLNLDCQQKFINFIVKNLIVSNPLVSIVSKIALCNPMSDTGCNYRNSELNVNQSIVKWKVEQEKLHNTIITLYGLIDIRDGAQECNSYSFFFSRIISRVLILL